MKIEIINHDFRFDCENMCMLFFPNSKFAADVDGTKGTTETDVNAILATVVGPPYVVPESQSLYCRKCGTKLASDSLFCHKCGTEVIKNVE